MVYGRQGPSYLWGPADSCQVAGRIPAAHKQGQRDLSLAREARARERQEQASQASP